MEGKQKVGSTFWLSPETVQNMDRFMVAANCRSRSEYAERAISFYNGYLESSDASSYLCEILSATIKGILENNSSKLSSLLFKWAVELNMLCHTIAAHYRMDEIDRRALRAFAVEEVKKNYGKISFDHALDVQRQIQ
jgi:hypothetical protein